MIYQSKVLQTILVFILLSTTSCSSLFPTPIPLSEIDLESIIIVPGDLPAGFSGAQVRDTPPEMFDDIRNSENMIYQQFEKGGEAAGGVTIFLFNLISERDIAYQRIIDGFGKSGENSEVKTTVEDAPNIGEKAMYMTIEASVLGIVINNEDLAFARCHAVIHIRMGKTANVDYLTAYANRLDKRLTQLVCG